MVVVKEVRLFEIIDVAVLGDIIIDFKRVRTMFELF